MARGSSGTDPTLDAQLKLMAAQTGLTVAQIQQIADEKGIKREELAQRGAIATEGFKVDREKIGLGREEMTLKDKQAKLGAALEAMAQSSKENIATRSEKAGIQSDLAHRTDIPQDVLARTLALGGNPELFNANAQAQLEKRNKAVKSYIPPLQAAKSDAEREKKYKPALDAIDKNAYAEALALAYPKAGQVAPSATPEPAPTPTNAPVESGGANPLAATLLAAAGFGGNGANEGTGERAVRPRFPTLPNTPETSYTGLGHGSLEGSQRVAGGIRTPSGGFIGGTLGEDRLAKLIEPRGAATQVATNAPAANVPTIDVPLVPPPTFDFNKLLANNNGAATVNPTPTPAGPVIRQGPSPEELAALAEQERQRKLREALALQAQNSQ